MPPVTKAIPTSHHVIRHATPSDAQELLGLMRALARFEGYLDAFRVTVDDLLARGLHDRADRQFVAFVAERDGQLLAYGVVYAVPFTYDLRPTLILKELYVRETARGCGLGDALMAAVIAHARQLRCARLKWDVLPDNLPAQRFYRRHGGAPDIGWQQWIRILDPAAPA